MEVFSLFGDEEVISLLHTKVYVFSDSVLCLGMMNENSQSNTAWEQRLEWFKTSQEDRNLDTIDGEPMEFEWNVFPGFTTLQLCYSVQEFLSKMSEEPEEFTRKIIFMSMFNDISWESEDNTKECELSAQLVSLYARRFGARQWSFLGLGSEKNGTLPVKTVHKEKGTELQSKWCWHLENAHTQSSDPRVHCPEECLNAKVVENCQYIVAPISKR